MRWLGSGGRIRLLEWEYWPTLAFYWPMLLIGPLLALRSRHPCFFTAANPGLFAGGLGLESKMATLRMIPSAWRPRTLLVQAGGDTKVLSERLAEAGIVYPLVAKPDLGYRGMAVKKVDTPEELLAHLREHAVPFLLQEFLDYPTEIGVLYYRDPKTGSGRVSSLTLKNFLFVTGDGRSTVRQLMRREDRALRQIGRLEREDPGLLDRVPGKGERFQVSIVGNHAKGTAFLNGNRLIDEALRARMEEIARPLAGFHYGRFDIKCASLDDFKRDGDFRIIEVNGVCSEPTHIYDAQQNSYFDALGAIIRHWRLIRRIAAANHRRGVAYLAPGRMLRALGDWRAYLRRLAP